MRYLMCIAVITSALMVLQCEEPKSITGVETSQHGDNDNIGFLAKEKAANDFDDLRSQLKFIAKKLSKNKKWVEKKLINQAKEAGVPIDELKGLKINKNLKFEDLKYNIKVEMLNESRADELLQNMIQPTFGVILDPDIFYANADHVPVYMNDGSSSTIFLPPIDAAKEDHNVDSYLNIIGFPIFVVTIEEIEDPAETEKIRQELLANSVAFQQSKLNKTGGTPFVVVKEITLRDDKDWGNEEFELYIGEGSNPIQSRTIHKFNGRTRSDAAQPSVEYKDINRKATYTMDKDIALWPLSGGVTIRFFALDDDKQSGKHWRSNRRDDPYINAYRVSTNSRLSTFWNVSHYYRIMPFNDDDIYGQSGIEHVSEQTLNNRIGKNGGYIESDDAINGPLKDANWKIGLKYY